MSSVVGGLGLSPGRPLSVMDPFMTVSGKKTGKRIVVYGID
jgi:hypothetical protein